MHSQQIEIFGKKIKYSKFRIEICILISVVWAERNLFTKMSAFVLRNYTVRQIKFMKCFWEISSIGWKYKPNERIRVLRFFSNTPQFFFLLISVERGACSYNLLLFIFELVTNILYSVEITHIRLVYESNTEFESEVLHVRSLNKSFACYSKHLRSYTIM